MTKGEAEVLRNVIARLEGNERASETVAQFFQGEGRPYARTWLIAPLRALLPESRDMRHARRMSR